eukprot:Gregarina_sp_Pseudo_9__1172@NODE_1770_length_1341_cov_40_112135_g1639_i0_p1_GENE_NODE_1770_length_1341_cov_40_112135_g1639_i0NODE_1770_length_1341_cov_40_112135_g1639_i0_p1_ORF_typecomplete_len373_score35_03_NODE_1770_length_1341_cov_40_112135_g1639_i0261120
MQRKEGSLQVAKIKISVELRNSNNERNSIRTMESWTEAQNEEFSEDFTGVKCPRTFARYPGGLGAIPLKYWVKTYPKKGASFYEKIQPLKDLTFAAAKEINKKMVLDRINALVEIEDQKNRMRFFDSLSKRVKIFTDYTYPVMGLESTIESILWNNLPDEEIPRFMLEEAQRCRNTLQNLPTESQSEKELMSSTILAVTDASWLKAEARVILEEEGEKDWLDKLDDETLLSTRTVPQCIVKMKIGEIEEWDKLQLAACVCGEQKLAIGEKRLIACICLDESATPVTVCILEVGLPPKGLLEYRVVLEESFSWYVNEFGATVIADVNRFTATQVANFQRLLGWLASQNEGELRISCDLVPNEFVG